MYVVFRRGQIYRSTGPSEGVDAMTHGAFDEPVDLYRSGELGLARAAARAGVSTNDFALELRSRGVVLREEDQTAATSTRY
jgi:hypothetical protein